MMRFPVPRRNRNILEITPLVDVVFLLLVFFLLTSTSMTRSMDVDLPQASSAQVVTRRSTVVSVLADGGLRVDGISTELEVLEGMLRLKLSEGDGPALTIEADRKVSFDRFAQVLDVARMAGAKEINLATDLIYQGSKR